MAANSSRWIASPLPINRTGHCITIIAYCAVMNTQPEIYRCYYTPCSILPSHTAAVALSSSVVCAHTWVHLVCTCMVWWVGGTTSKAGEPRTGVWRARLQEIWTLGNFDAATIVPGQCSGSVTASRRKISYPQIILG